MDNPKLLTKKNKVTSFGNYFLLFTILFVSTMGVIGGFLLNNYIEQVNNSRSTAIKLWTDISKMQNYAELISQADNQIYLLRDDLLMEAFNLHLAYLAINGTDPNREMELLDRCLFVLYNYEYSATFTFCYLISDVFLNSSINICILADETKEGYNYIITRDQFDKYPPLYAQSFDETLIYRGFNASFVDYIMDYSIPTYPYCLHKYYNYLLDVYNLHSLLNEPISELRLEALSAGQSADNMQIHAILLSTAVGIIAVAEVIVIQIQMRNQAKESEKKFSLVRSDLLKDKSLIKKEKERLSYIILGLVSIFSVICILIAIF
jgi:hypothetical protein